MQNSVKKVINKSQANPSTCQVDGFLRRYKIVKMIGDIAHVCNRGVDKRNIFDNKNDYERFVDNLFLLNNLDGKLRSERKNIFAKVEKLPKQEKLVEVLKWSLLPNHYHILLYENVDGGILEFTKRLGNAYTKYFNLKNKGRSGYLFQNAAKIVPIGSEAHMPYLPIYIDLNAAGLTKGSEEEIFDFLLTYEWSSLKEYFARGNREAIINIDLFYELFETDEQKYLKDLKGFIGDRKKLQTQVELQNPSTWQVDGF